VILALGVDILNREMKLRVLKNGPAKDSQEELDCAAWLISNNLANGNVLSDFTRVGSHVSSIIWQGANPAGEKYLRNSKVTGLLFNPYVVWAITGAVVLLFSYFIDDASKEATQPQIPVYTQQEQ